MMRLLLLEKLLARETLPFAALAYADDLALVAELEIQRQILLKVSFGYTANQKVRFAPEKCKVSEIHISQHLLFRLET
jgi:hypothetical protein